VRPIPHSSGTQPNDDASAVGAVGKTGDHQPDGREKYGERKSRKKPERGVAQSEVRLDRRNEDRQYLAIKEVDSEYRAEQR